MEQDTYSLYFLYDPRTGIMCYVGITKQLFKHRLLQHRNPVASNRTPIAKLQRTLKKKGMSLYGEVMLVDSMEVIERAEKTFIEVLRLADNPKLKNVQDGGLNSFGNTKESIEKAKVTKKLNREKGLHQDRSGEKSSSSKVTESEVLEIYRLIKLFYSNDEIIETLELNIGKSTIAQMRNGSNWKNLWDREKMVRIPSSHKEPNGLPTIEKIKLISRIENEEDLEKLKENYKMFSITDLKRIKSKNIWKPIWNLYYNYYKKEECI